MAGEPTPVFGLTKAELRPIVEAAAGEEVAGFEVSVAHDVPGHYGYGAEKVVPTFTYQAASGRSDSVTVFVKWFHQRGPREAHHYAHLMALDAPVPRCYGSLTDPDDREIIFVEHLEPLCDRHPFRGFFGDVDRFRDFLAVTARFNAIKPPPEYAAAMGCRDVKRDLAHAPSVLQEVWEHALAGDIGPEMAEVCAERRDDLPRLQQLTRDIVEPICDMPTGLAHNDFHPDSIAWRRATGEMLIVDLESVGLAPRFYDVSRWLGAPDHLEPRCRPQRELAQHYLDHYRRWGGDAVTVDAFLDEASLLWLACTFTMLFFRLHRALDGEVDWTDDREEARRLMREDLRKKVLALVSHGSPPQAPEG